MNGKKGEFKTCTACKDALSIDDFVSYGKGKYHAKCKNCEKRRKCPRGCECALLAKTCCLRRLS